MTTPSQHDILNIEDALVSDENPPRNLDSLDYERCARLHNYIVAYTWMVYHRRDTPDLNALTKEHFRWKGYDEDRVVTIRSRLDSSLNSFLDLTYDPDLPFFYWVYSLLMRLADDCFLGEENELEDQERERFVIIYDTNPSAFSHTLGVVYDQQRHLAAFPLTIEDSESVEPIDEHKEMWFPLETILTHWIFLIRLGKAVIDHNHNNLSRSHIGLWGWLPYCHAQIESTVAAIDRYTAIIESRMPTNSLLSVSGPLFTDAELDAAAVPQECFVRSLLTRVKTPRFKSIAPGLLVPHDKAAFIRRQKFTTGHLNDRSGREYAPAVLLFPAADSDAVVNFNQEIRWLFLYEVRYVIMDESDLIPAGLYSEATDRGAIDSEETGFRLLLPFTLNGARRSDRSLVEQGSFADLFQHGQFRPFGGSGRVQRLERLFERWTELIETGVWTVGRDGVEGSIDKFRDANGNGWMDYWIAPSW